MNASILYAKHDLRLEELDYPEPGSNDVTARVKACGICGSDISMYEGVYSGLARLPVVMGHEWSGRVVEVGEDVRRFKRGDRITAENVLWCGMCTTCLEGKPLHCTNREELGFTVNGAFAEYVKIHEKHCYELPANFPFEAGALVEPTSVPYNGVNVVGGGIEPGQTVAIFGLGPIGLGALSIVKASSGQVFAFDPIELRRNKAKELDADYVANPLKEDIVKLVMGKTNDLGVDMVIEASGSGQALKLALDLVTFKGKIIQIGQIQKPVEIFPRCLVWKGVAIIGSEGHGEGHGVFPKVIKMMALNIIDQTKIITHRFSLDKLNEAIKFASKRKDEAIKIIIKP